MQTNDISKASLTPYEVTFQCCLAIDFTICHSSNFFVTVTYTSSTSPYFAKTIPSSVSLKIDSSKTFTIPMVQSFNGIPYTVNVNLGVASAFITGTYPSFQINPTSADALPGSYNIQVLLTYSNPQLHTETFNVTVVVQPLIS